MTTAPLSLEHLIRPSNLTNQKPGVLFLFHGYGSNEEDLFSFASELPDELCIIAARAPYNLEPYGHAWYAINFDAEQGKWSDLEQAKTSRDLLISFIEEACKTYGLDQNNISLLGFSQGSILSYSLALSYPEKFKNIIALSGYLNEDILTPDHKEKLHAHLNFYVSHGSVDQVIPLEWAQKAPGILKRYGIEAHYKEFPVGHGVSPQNFHDFSTWLKKQLEN